MKCPLPLVVRSPNWLGDAVMTWPAIYNLKKWLGTAPLTVATPEKLAALWSTCPAVDQVIVLRQPKSILATSAQLRSGKFRTALLFPNSLRVALEARLAGINTLIGYGGRGRGWLGLQAVPRRLFDLQHCHQKLDSLHLVAALGAEKTEPALHLDLQLELPAKIEAPPIVICPGAEYGPAKRWPEDFFAALGQQLIGRYSVPVHFMGASGDAALGAHLAKRVPGSENKCGKTTLRQFMVQLARARLVICNDSGAMHLAALLGVPTVALFGSTEPRLTGPLGNSVRVLREYVPCGPCFLRTCPLDFSCMKSITPAQVLAVCAELLSTPE